MTRQPFDPPPLNPAAIERLATCDGKFAYATAAKAWAVMAKRRPGERKKRRHPYRCPFCHHWHIGGYQ